ncbi:MAG TPA: hypothetical protein VHE33_15015 [Acidobacteriaceae bacterium]|nr:hypothetical protein [Acidobacteriaceae bacterium]
MSAAPALAIVVPEARAVAETELPVYRPKPIEGFAFYRKHTLALLRHYLDLSMKTNRASSVLDRVILRGRVSSYRLRTFEDGIIFVLDVEKCLQQLDRLSRKVVFLIALQDYSVPETAWLTGESLRSAARIYGEAMNRLTAKFLQLGLLKVDVEKLSRGEAEIQSNDIT